MAIAIHQIGSAPHTKRPGIENCDQCFFRRPTPKTESLPAEDDSRGQLHADKRQRERQDANGQAARRLARSETGLINFRARQTSQNTAAGHRRKIRPAGRLQNVFAVAMMVVAGNHASHEFDERHKNADADGKQWCEIESNAWATRALLQYARGGFPARPPHSILLKPMKPATRNFLSWFFKCMTIGRNQTLVGR
jgi:hypothetical protein